MEIGLEAHPRLYSAEISEDVIVRVMSNYAHEERWWDILDSCMHDRLPQLRENVGAHCCFGRWNEEEGCGLIL